MIKSINMNFTEHFTRAAIKLKNDGLICPVYWITNFHNSEIVEKSFPDCISHNLFDAIKGIEPQNFNIKINGEIDEPFLKEISVIESMCMNMFNRNDVGNNMNHDERMKMYHYYIKYWKSAIDYLKPDIIIFNEEPHTVFQLITYHLCKIKNIPIIMSTGTIFPKKILFIEDMDIGPSMLVKKYNDLVNKNVKDEIQLPTYIRTFLDKIKSDSDGSAHVSHYMPIVSKKFDSMKKSTIFPSMIFNIVKNNLNVFKFFKRLLNLFKVVKNDQCGINGKFFKYHPSNFDLYRIEKNYYIKNKKTLRHYLNIQKNDFDINSPFVLFPLHLEPEKTTNPMGGHYFNQILAVELLAKHLPKGWSIFVKEHMSQFTIQTFGNSSKGRSFYNHISSLNNTYLIPSDFPIRELIKKSKSVFTITGTVAMEAAILGVPAGYFGNAWYRGLPNTYPLKSSDDVEEFFHRVINNDLDNDFKKIKLFFKAFDKVALDGIHLGAAVNDDYFEQNVEFFYKHYKTFLKNRFPSKFPNNIV